MKMKMRIIMNNGNHYIYEPDHWNFEEACSDLTIRNRSDFCYLNEKTVIFWKNISSIAQVNEYKALPTKQKESLE